MSRQAERHQYQRLLPFQKISALDAKLLRPLFSTQWDVHQNISQSSTDEDQTPTEIMEGNVQQLPQHQEEEQTSASIALAQVEFYAIPDQDLKESVPANDSVLSKREQEGEDNNQILEDTIQTPSSTTDFGAAEVAQPQSSPSPTTISAATTNSLKQDQQRSKNLIEYAPGRYRRQSVHNGQFQVALSFAGDERLRVEPIAELLESELGPNQVFYDKWYEAEMYLYRKRSSLIVVFECPQYRVKEWCKLEWRGIRELLKTGQEKRIMLLSSYDLHPLPGTYSGDGYLSIKDKSSEVVVDNILIRLSTLND
ncbi:unnamed protein product [Didymodactylos carnosus]|uniref:TIR domain-containing protein n=1 Tax=Didymodactylos carnosus TaxID=1234261 RepID=A0A815EU15_9BILA|nr:unnamed protein product [Didymodactylos carnosus]CAF4164944.1 unnamed protein product [Didymodactylos carnosus]